MSVEDEIFFLDKEIDYHAAIHGMARNDFLNALDSVSPDVAAAMIPLLRRRIHLFREVWDLRSQENGTPNLLLFSRGSFDVR